MSYTNDDLDLARALFGADSQKAQDSSAQTNTYFGYAQTDSKDGWVMVVIDGDVLSAQGQAVNLKTTVSVKAGQRVIITVYGNSMVVTGVIGGGDSMAGDIADAVQTANKTSERYDELGNKVDEFGNRLDMTDEELKRQAKIWEKDLNDLAASVHNFDIQYAVNASSTNPPASAGTWWTSVPSDSMPKQGQYLWSRIIGVDGLHQVVILDPRCVSNGQAVFGVTELYYLSTSNASPQGGEWVERIPPYEAGKYYWGRTRVQYSTTSADSNPELVVFPNEVQEQYVWEDSEGLHVSHANPIGASTPNTLLTGTSLQMRYGWQILGSFAAGGVELMNGMSSFTSNEVNLNNGMGKFTSNSVELCNGAGTIAVDNSGSLTGDRFNIRSNNKDMQLTSTGAMWHLANTGIQILGGQNNAGQGYVDMRGGGYSSTTCGRVYLTNTSIGLSGTNFSVGNATIPTANLAANMNGGVLLFQQDGNPSYGNITLSETIANFCMAIILYHNRTTDTYNELVLTDPKTRNFHIMDWLYDTQGPRIAISCLKMHFNNNRTLTRDTEYYATLPNNGAIGIGTQSNTNDRKIGIVRVYGYYKTNNSTMYQ